MEETDNLNSDLEKSFEAVSIKDVCEPNESTNETCICTSENSIDVYVNEGEIKAALTQQTKHLYEQYAREQFPKDIEKQNELIAEMQEQYFGHYLSEVHRFQIIHQRQQIEQLTAIHLASKETDLESEKTDEEANSAISLEPLPLIPATIWVRKDIAEFKREILETQKECCIKISSLATATVRVPTHPNGKAICWEFATDYYDLGFGLYFEWDLEPPENVSVNISESSDDEETEEDDEVTGSNSNDVNDSKEVSPQDLERGRKNTQPRVPTDELIPIYRRDCHTEVYCGTHQYPGIGVYVFKFDNSFSLWRSKWLYYRIYYTH